VSLFPALRSSWDSPWTSGRLERDRQVPERRLGPALLKLSYTTDFFALNAFLFLFILVLYRYRNRNRHVDKEG
jgi:hypothetical protein